MKHLRGAGVLCLALFIFCAPALADTMSDLLDSVKQNYQSGKYSKALDDLEWVKKEIVKKHLESLRKFLPNNVPGFKQEDPSGANVLTMTTLTRNYKQQSGDGSVEVSIIAGGAESGFGAAMGMATMFGAMGQDENTSMIMSHGKRGTLVREEDGQKYTAMFSLGKNGIVSLNARGFENDETIKKFAEMIDLAGLEKEFQ